MRIAEVRYDGIPAGELRELDNGQYTFTYLESYIQQYPDRFITFQMPVSRQTYRSNRLFPFFDGLIPEGWLLQIAAENWRIRKNDRMGLLLACCRNAIGAVSVHPITPDSHE